MAIDAQPSQPLRAAEELLDRDDEVELLAGVVRDAIGGRGTVVFVEGPPGIGKSALLAAAAGIARRLEFVVLAARAHELEQMWAWGVGRSLLEPALATLSGADREELLESAGAAATLFLPGAPADGLDEPRDGYGVVHGFYRMVTRLAEHRPLLLSIDDAQWADSPSLRFILHLLGRISATRIAVLVGARRGEQGHELLERLATDQVTVTLQLTPLREEAVAALVRRSVPAADGALCRRCFELTGGNPFQLGELTVALSRVPDATDPTALPSAVERAAHSIGRSVRLRLAALGAAAQEVTRAVAVLEDDAPLAVVSALTGLDTSAVLEGADALVGADVLRPGTPLGFAHPLLRAAVYEQVPLQDRARMHADAARLLAQQHESAERIAAHLLRGAPEENPSTVDVLRAAARRAVAQGAPASAVSYLERALNEPPPQAVRASVLAELGQAEALIGSAAAIAHFEAAIALLTDPHERAATLLELGRSLGAQGGRLPEAATTFKRGLEALGPNGGELALDLERGLLTAMMHEPALAADLHRRAASILGREDALHTRAGRGLVSMTMMVQLFAAAPHQEVLGVAHRLFDDGRLVEEDRPDSQALTHLIGALSWCDDYAAADTVLRLTLGNARRRGSALTLALCHQLRARQSSWTGPVDAAIEDARAAIEVWRETAQIYLHPSAYCLVQALLERDDVEQAELILAECRNLPAPSGFFAAWMHAISALVLDQRGEVDRALDQWLAAGASLTQLQIVNPTVLPWRSAAALLARRLDQRERSADLIREEIELAEQFGAPRARGIAYRAAGLLTRGEAASERLAAAADLHAQAGARLEHAKTLVALGGAIRRAGRPRDARGPLRDAAAIAEELGATAVLRAATEELRRAGARPSARSTPSDELTPSERRVAELAAAGHTNREIAGTLFVTNKAVEWHLANAYRKLNIRGRHDLAAALQPRSGT